MEKNIKKHQFERVPVASGAGYIKCECGWKSQVQDDGNMFNENAYSAEDDYNAHLEKANERRN